MAGEADDHEGAAGPRQPLASLLSEQDANAHLRELADVQLGVFVAAAAGGRNAAVAEQLVAQLADVPHAREALRVLVEDELATRLGDRVGCSRAAVRFDTLAPR